MKPILNYSEISRHLTGNKDQIRADYSGKKYAEPVRELREFETKFKLKYPQVNIKTN